MGRRRRRQITVNGLTRHSGARKALKRRKALEGKEVALRTRKALRRKALKRTSSDTKRR